MSLFGPQNPFCPVCASRRVRPLADALYCDVCGLYIPSRLGTTSRSTPASPARPTHTFRLPPSDTLSNNSTNSNNPLPTPTNSLTPPPNASNASPTPPAFQPLTLCPKCRENRPAKPIQCTSAEEYLKKMRLCACCRSKNEERLRGDYSRNFLLFRRERRVFSWLTVFLIAALLWGADTPLSVWAAAAWVSGGWAARVFWAVVLGGAGRFEVVRRAVGVAVVWRVWRARRVVFELPVDPSRGDDLRGLVGRLRIS